MADPIDPSDDDLSRAQRIAQPIGRFMHRWRNTIARRPWLNGIYKVLITCIGVSVIIIGLILVPLPGPGWLIVFIGLTVLGSEYHWARRLTSWLRMQLARFWLWWRARRERKKGSKPKGSLAAVRDAEGSNDGEPSDAEGSDDADGSNDAEGSSDAEPKNAEPKSAEPGGENAAAAA